MVVLTCSENDCLHIGDDVTVEILEVCDEFIRLGISTVEPIPGYTEQTVYLKSAGYTDHVVA